MQADLTERILRGLYSAVLYLLAPITLYHLVWRGFRQRAYFQRWVDKEETDFADLSPSIVDLYKRSLLVVRTQIDEGGGILAANDSDIMQFARDTYSYVWPRDGASTLTLTRAQLDALVLGLPWARIGEAGIIRVL